MYVKLPALCSDVVYFYSKVCENPKVTSIEKDALVAISPPSNPETSTPSTAAPITTVTTTTTTTTTTGSTPSEVSTTSTIRCSKLRGGKIKSQGSKVCRIYMKTTSTQSDCRKFVRKMKAMNKNYNNGIKFVTKEVGHHKQRPMIKARLNLKALDMVNNISMWC